jgi:hypothetical protein
MRPSNEEQSRQLRRLFKLDQPAALPPPPPAPRPPIDLRNLTIEELQNLISLGVERGLLR